MTDIGFNDNTYKRIVDPGELFTHPDITQPGVGGRAGPMSHLVQDPATGLYYDAGTGTTYTDASGQTPVTNPNVAQQVASNFAVRSNFLNQLGGVQQQQNALAGHLNNVIAGNAPSLAAMQAQQGLNQAAGEQQSMAAGVGGAASPLAHLMAARNVGAAQIGANNAASMGRAAEGMAASNQLGGLLNTMAGQNLEGATGFGSQAAAGQAGQQGLNFQGDIENQKQKNQTIMGAGGALSILAK